MELVEVYRRRDNVMEVSDTAESSERGEGGGGVEVQEDRWRWIVDVDRTA